MTTAENIYRSETCRACGTDVIWAHSNPGHKTDTFISVDAAPAADGTVILARDTTVPIAKGQPVPIRATTLRPGQAAGARQARQILYRAHRLTCPHAHDHVPNSARR